MLLQILCGNAGGRAFLKQSVSRMPNPEVRAAALRRLPRGAIEEHFAQFLTEVPEQQQQERAPAPKCGAKAAPTRKRPAAALGSLGVIAQAVLSPLPMRRRFGKQPPVENEAPLPVQAAEDQAKGKGRLRRCGTCRWLGVPQEDGKCPSGHAAWFPAEELYYHGPWGRYNLTLKSGKQALTPERLENCLDELAAGSKSQYELAREYGVPRRTLCTWQRNPGPTEEALRNHTQAIAMILDGKPRAAVRDTCHVHESFFAAVLKELPVAAKAWKEEAARSFGVRVDALPPAASCFPGLDELGKWMQLPSWSFCPHCGLRSTEASVRLGWRKKGLAAVATVCPGGCDSNPTELETEWPEEGLPPRTTKLMAYITPQTEHWKPLREALPGDEQAFASKMLPGLEWSALAPVELKVDFETRRGGRASITSKQKKSLVRAVWKPCTVERSLGCPAARQAFVWLMGNNPTYRHWVEHHNTLVQGAATEDTSWRSIKTAELLLRSPGLEVAARPWLYPRSSLADSDIASRLAALRRLPDNAKPSLRTSFFRKLRSRCQDYGQDFALMSFLHDSALAAQISSIVALAASKQMAPDDLASGSNNFEAYWQQQTERLEDVCRQMGALPNLFFTVAPAEWSFPAHYGLLQAAVTEDKLSNCQAILTMHLHHCIAAVLEHAFLKEGRNLQQCGLEKVHEYVLRFEFQKRGTVHVHVLGWVKFLPGQNVALLTGRSGQAGLKSPFVAFLEEVFQCGAVDVVCAKEETDHLLLKYVAGYTAKASDALHFHRQEAQGQGNQDEQSQWAQIYRMLCKNSPLEQEMTMEFACLPMIKASFTGDYCYAPVPGSEAINNSRHAYLAFQQHLCANHVSVNYTSESGEAKKHSFLEWYRRWHVASKQPTTTEQQQEGAAAYKYDIKQRNLAGPGRGKRCAVGIRFTFELLDIFIGQFAATFLPGALEASLIHPAPQSVPENCQHLSHILTNYFQNDPYKLIEWVSADLRRRGLKQDRINTFADRVLSCALLLAAVRRGQVDPVAWSARRIFARPERIWSREQQAVLDAVAAGTSVLDANEIRTAKRLLQVCGGPGTGKTEVILEAAVRAANSGCRAARPTAAKLTIIFPQQRKLMGSSAQISSDVCRCRSQEQVPEAGSGRFRRVLV